MKFKDVIGQNSVKEKLVQSYYDNRVSHSYLFYGNQGVGKLALAIAFAQFLSCEDKQGNDSCGKCPSCLKYEKLIHPDLHFSFPVVSTGSTSRKPISDTFLENWRAQVTKSPYFSYNEWLRNLESENKQGSIYSEESAEIIKKVSLKSYESDYKILIMWLPEKMNIACANKLLKVLEEPPQNTIFILVSNSREDVLQTILSRTQPVKILGIEDSCLKQALMDNFNIDEIRANDLVKISDGSYIEAKQQLMDDEENKFNFESFKSFMRICYAQNVIEAIAFSKQISKMSRERQKSFLNYAMVLIRENFILNIEKDIVYLTHEEESFSSKFSRFINVRNINEFLTILNNSYYHIERNANSEIVFTDTAFNIMKIIRK